MRDEASQIARCRLLWGILLTGLGPVALAFPLEPRWLGLVGAGGVSAVGVWLLASQTAYRCKLRRADFSEVLVISPRRLAAAFIVSVVLGAIALWLRGRGWSFPAGIVVGVIVATYIVGAWRPASPLHAAAYRGLTEEVLRIVSGSEDLANLRGRYGRTPLHVASAAGRSGVVRVLLDAGADINARADGDWTALHWASMRCHADVVRLLVGASANLHVVAEDGSSALFWAVRGKCEECASILLDAGSDPNVPDTCGRTPLALAVKRGQRRMAALLVAHGARE